MNQAKLFFTMMLCGVVLLAAGAAWGAEFHVEQNNKDQLAAALETAERNSEPDTIYLAAGTYNGSFGYHAEESDADQALTIRPENGLNRGQVILDGNLDGVRGRCLSLTTAGSGDFTLEKITCANGRVYNGKGAGAQIDTNGDVSVTDCAFTGNMLQYNVPHGGVYGGGIYVANAATFAFRNCTISGSYGDYCGDNGGAGGIAMYVTGVSSTEVRDSSFSNSSGENYSNSIVRIGSISVTVEGCSIANNQSYHWRLLEIDSADTVTMHNNSITGNTLEYDGVGTINIDPNRSASVTLTNNTITNNEVGGNYGGVYVGMAGNGSQLTFTGNTVSGNKASATYGGACLSINEGYTGTIICSNNVIENNTAGSDNSFGGLRILANNSGSTVEFSGNRIADNSAGRNYGGACVSSGLVSAVNNVIIGNQAPQLGGLYLYAYNDLHFINNTIAGNSDSDEVGGASLGVTSGHTGHFYNNIIWGNTSSGGFDDLYLHGSGSKYGYNNNVGETYGIWDASGGNTANDPLFADAANSDYHLSAGSLCLNAGDNAAPGIPDKDHDNGTRICDGAVDQGAYEHCTDALHPADVNTDWVISADEYANYADAWKAGDTWPVSPSPIPIDYVTRAGYLQQQSGGQYHNIGGGKPLCWEAGTAP